LKDILIDFGLPFFLIAVLSALLFCGIDGEVKAMLAVAVGWVFKSGYQRRPSGKGC